MESINEREEKLFTRWEKESLNNHEDSFCRDGLIFNGKCTQTGNYWNAVSGNQEALWNNTKRKILFLMKEPNDNPKNDYRNWGLEGKTKSAFFKLIYSWLNGLTTIKADDTQIPPITNEFSKILPLVIVNAKKASGGASANDNLVYAHAEKDKEFLRAQFDIYAPNIILCGGGYTCKNQEVLIHYIANNLIYADIEFTKMDGSNWIWYSIEKKMVLINSYHPVAHRSNESKYNTLIEHFQRFLKLNLFEL